MAKKGKKGKANPGPSPACGGETLAPCGRWADEARGALGALPWGRWSGQLPDGAFCFVRIRKGNLIDAAFAENRMVVLLEGRLCRDGDCVLGPAVPERCRQLVGGPLARWQAERDSLIALVSRDALAPLFALESEETTLLEALARFSGSEGFVRDLVLLGFSTGDCLATLGLLVPAQGAPAPHGDRIFLRFGLAGYVASRERGDWGLSLAEWRSRVGEGPVTRFLELVAEATPVETLEVDLLSHSHCDEPRASRPRVVSVFSLLLAVTPPLLLGILLAVAIPLLYRHVFETVVKQRRADLLIPLLGVMLAMHLLATVNGFVRDYLVAHHASRLQARLLSRFVAKCFRLPLASLEGRGNGELSQRFSEVGRLFDVFSSRVSGVLVGVLQIGAQLAVFAFLDSRLALLVVACLLVMVAVTLPLAKLSRRMVAATLALGSRSRALLFEQVRMAELLASLQGLSAARWRWEKIQARVARCGLRANLAAAAVSGAALALPMFVRALVLFAAILLYLKGEMSLGMALAVALLASDTLKPAMHVLRDWRSLVEVAVIFGRVTRFLTEPEERASSPEPFGAATLITSRQNVVLFPGRRLFLQVDDETARGRLALALARLHPMDAVIFSPPESPLPEGGGVTLVRLGGHLFPGTILENIGMADAVPSLDRAIRAARALECHELILGTKKAYGTQIPREPQGMALKLRAAILLCRAFYLSPACVVVDCASAEEWAELRAPLECARRAWPRVAICVLGGDFLTAETGERFVLRDQAAAALPRPSEFAEARAGCG